MIEDVLAVRYARSLVDVAVANGVMDRVRTELEAVARLLSSRGSEGSSPELVALLRSPRVPSREKVRITDELCKGLELTEDTARFLGLLVCKNRVALVGRIAWQFRTWAARARSVVAGDVESAKSLSAEQLEGVRAALTRAFGRQVELTAHVRPELLAGVRVRISGRVLDGSLDGALQRVEARLRG